MLSKLKPALRALQQVTLLYYLLFAVLIILVLYASFFTGQPGAWGTFTLDGYRELLDAQGIGEIFFNSLVYATARTAISLVLALTFAWAVARAHVPGRALMELLI